MIVQPAQPGPQPGSRARPAVTDRQSRPSYNDEEAPRSAQPRSFVAWRTSNATLPTIGAASNSSIVARTVTKPSIACASCGTGRDATPRPSGDPPFWVVREGPTLIAACPLTPVRVSVRGEEVRRRVERRSAGGRRTAAAGTGRVVAARLGSWHRSGVRRGFLGRHAAAAGRDALAEAGPAAVPGQAAQPARAATADLAGAGQPAGVGARAAVRASRVARSGRCSEEVEAVRRFDTRRRSAVGAGQGHAGPGGPPRRALPQLEVHRAAARALSGGRAAPRRRGRRLRGLPPPARAAGPRHADRRLPGRSGGRARDCRRCRLGRSRGARRRLRQDSLLRHARRVPPRAAPHRVLRA